MRMTMTAILLAIMLPAALPSESPLFSDDVRSVQIVQRGATDNGIALGIQAQRTQVRVGEKIELTAAIVNTTSAPAYVYLPSMLAYSYSITLRSGAGVTTLRLDPGKPLASESMYFKRAIPPQAAALETIVLTNMFTVPRPGDLAVSISVRSLPWARYPSAKISLVSNTVHIKVLP